MGCPMKKSDELQNDRSSRRERGIGYELLFHILDSAEKIDAICRLVSLTAISLCLIAVVVSALVRHESLPSKILEGTLLSATAVGLRQRLH